MLVAFSLMRRVSGAAENWSAKRSAMSRQKEKIMMVRRMGVGLLSNA
jgi:hypothetical protein